MHRRAIRHERGATYAATTDSRHNEEQSPVKKDLAVAKTDVQPVRVMIETAIVQVKLKKELANTGCELCSD